YEGIRYDDTANLSALPPHLLFYANLNQQLGKNLGAFVNARNLFNTSYQSFKDYPMPGLTLTVGLRVKADFTPKGTRQ
ncbi:MAG: TonB-dependent receptor, partial [Treponema sp.]|nr:TonB-dependent receptor [Treponema sp.]